MLAQCPFPASISPLHPLANGDVGKHGAKDDDQDLELSKTLLEDFVFALELGKTLLEDFVFALELGKTLLEDFVFALERGNMLLEDFVFALEDFVFALELGKTLLEDFVFALELGKTLLEDFVFALELGNCKLEAFNLTLVHANLRLAHSNFVCLKSSIDLFLQVLDAGRQFGERQVRHQIVGRPLFVAEAAENSTSRRNILQILEILEGLRFQDRLDKSV